MNERVKLPNPEKIRISAISHLRGTSSQKEADLLSRCKLEFGDRAVTYQGSSIGIFITLRCPPKDLALFSDDTSFGFDAPSDMHVTIKNGIKSVLPSGFEAHDFSAKSFLVEDQGFQQTDTAKIIDAQRDLMISVATGGPRIAERNKEYVERRTLIQNRLNSLGFTDPNPFDDLWAWYGRWSSGDLPSYQSRRDYIRNLYQPVLSSLLGQKESSVSAPRNISTGWARVDRNIEVILNQLAKATREEEFQAVGLFCRECLISLAQAVYHPELHKPSKGVIPSKTDADKMLEAYFTHEYSGTSNEALRRHAKASLSLANGLVHRRTATTRDAALCAEATRTVVNIVAITSGKR